MCASPLWADEFMQKANRLTGGQAELRFQVVNLVALLPAISGAGKNPPVVGPGYAEHHAGCVAQVAGVPTGVDVLAVAHRPH